MFFLVGGAGSDGHDSPRLVLVPVLPKRGPRSFTNPWNKEPLGGPLVMLPLSSPHQAVGTEGRRRPRLAVAVACRENVSPSLLGETTLSRNALLP